MSNRDPLSRQEIVEAIGVIVFLALILALMIWRAS